MEEELQIEEEGEIMPQKEMVGKLGQIEIQVE